jgi:hypothetical protein
VVTAAVVSAFLPLTAAAQTTIDTVRGVLMRLNDLINIIAYFAVSAGVFLIIFGIARYLLAAGDERKRSEAGPFVAWGALLVFLMLSVWGFVNILLNTLAIDRGDLGTPAFFERNKIVLPTDPAYEEVVEISGGVRGATAPTSPVPRGRPQNFTELVNYAITDINTLIGLIVVLAGGVVAGVIINYMGAGGNREKMFTGQKLILLALIGLFVILSFWGIAFMIKRSLFGGG